jgi:hypothetical protein
MTADNFEQTIQAFHERTPFRPFTVVLISGRQFEVDHPKALIHRDGVAIYLAPGGVPTIFDHEGVEHFIGDLADRTSDAG